MPEHVLKFILSELERIRVVCQDPRCGAVTELTIERAQVRLEHPKCPVCQAEFFGPSAGHRNPLTALVGAVVEMQKYAKSVQVEFVLPHTGE